MKVCKNKKYENFAIMGKLLSLDIVRKLGEMSIEFFEPNMPKLVFALDLALENELPSNSYVGTYIQDDSCLFVQPINAGTLKYTDLKTMLPYATTMVNQIETFGFSTIEKIVWIDDWFQAHIQYIKNRETINANGKVYICEYIRTMSTVPNVLIDHYGVCEDIATSIVIILKKLNISCEEVQANRHAWLLVEVDGEYYLWDCTRNITRNPYMTPNGIKATKYSYQYTLLGEDFCNGKYTELSNMPRLSPFGYPRNKLDESIKKLVKAGITFAYPPTAKYNSIIKEEH